MSLAYSDIQHNTMYSYVLYHIRNVQQYWKHRQLLKRYNDSIKISFNNPYKLQKQTETQTQKPQPFTYYNTICGTMCLLASFTMGGLFVTFQKYV
jgi:hypothetical protein